MPIKKTVPKKKRAPATDAASDVCPIAPSNLAKRLGRKAAPEPAVHADPRTEVRRLIDMHKNWTETARSWRQSVTDRKNRETGEVIACTKPPHVVADAKNAADRLDAECKRLETAIESALEGVPIYREFLSKVYGLGPVVCGYLVAMVKIDVCRNVSQLIRYAGNGCTSEGLAERLKQTPKAIGGEGTYNAILKTRVWQGLIAMRKNAQKYTVCEAHAAVKPKKGTQAQKAAFRTLTLECKACRTTKTPNGSVTKYTRRWAEGLHSALTLPNKRLSEKAGAPTVMNGGQANEKGRRKATDLFLWDLYVVWRTLEGLTVRPDKYSAIRGRYHNGQEARDSEYVLTLEEARAIVGEPSASPATSWMWPIKVDTEETDPEAVDVAAE